MVTTVFGDINAFQAGVIGSGTFQSGFFPMYMGGLPGVAVAMIMATPKEKRKDTMTFLGGVAVVAFLTGIDEPLVFAFIFVSPLL
jgi:PTS system N-acetylglucosamine-specific IIC component